MRVIDACMRKAEAVARGGKVKTLRDEWFEGRTSVGTMAQRYVNERFLDRYGDYRVVEGSWHVGASGNLYIKEPEKEPSLVARRLTRVKLILPPEEKELSLDGAREQILEAQLEATRGREFQERDRADRYEKALREIAERDEEAMPLSTEYQLTKMLCAVATLAREALDD